MLAELNVRNLAVIEELRLELGQKLTVLSGEEGAGKSLLVDALCLLVGGKAATSLIRSGASAAAVEGVFWTPADDQDLASALEEAGIEPEADGSLILAREVRDNGRSTARVNGRAVPVSVLQKLGRFLMDVSSQTEHMSLLNPQRQIDILDGYGGLTEDRRRLAAKLRELGDAARELNALNDRGSERQRDLLEYQVAEIEAAEISPGEDEVLERERQLLQRAQTLKEGCCVACGCLYSDDSSAAGLVHDAIKSLRGIVGIDPSLGPHLEALESAATGLEETARDLRQYAEAVDARAEQIEQVEKRLEVLRHLKTKYGPALSDVLDFAERARQELEAIRTQDDRKSRLEEQVAVLETEAGGMAAALSAARQEAAGAQVELVNSELAGLGMPWAGFDISLSRDESETGLPACGGRFLCGQSGMDRADFLGVTNPGEPLRPLSEIASGGETCRFMLAVKSALRKADPVPTLVFDEVDAGIGGRNAQVVGRKLAALAQDRQVICITHLPQIACFGQAHYRVVKDVSSGRSFSRVERLDTDSRTEELAAMMGGSEDSPMLDSASELLRQAGESAAVAG